MKNTLLYTVLILILGVTTGCEDFLNPQQDLVLPTSSTPADEVELRSISLGLYSLQQELVDQIVILGELRADLLTVTDNADQDLIEINKCRISSDNKYASPATFYRLIGACNKMIRILEKKHPEVMDEDVVINNYHKMYGEAVCMRSWAYFNAVRIFDEIPYIPETLNTIDEINDFVNSPGTYTDSIYIDYSPSGLENDTIFDTTFVYTDKKFFGQDAMTRQCIKDINTKVNVVGVDYSNKDEIADETWNITVWNTEAMEALLIQMYLHINDYDVALDKLNTNFLRRSQLASESSLRYGLDGRFANSNWKSIFTNIDGYEHIYTLKFQKTSTSWQQNNLQNMFSAIPPNAYLLKPTPKAITAWESSWRGKQISTAVPSQAETIVQGTPGDFNRGYNVSYRYLKDGFPLSNSQVQEMLDLKKMSNLDEMNEIMKGVDTVVYKYTLGKGNFDRDADFIVYRASTMHLYAAEIACNRQYYDGPSLRHDVGIAERFIYDGNYMSATDARRGVAGRVGFSDNSGLEVDKEQYFLFDESTNEIIGYVPFTSTQQRQLYMEDAIMKERGRELAYEGERFYDYVRMARRRDRAGNNGTEWLAESISSKFSGAEKEELKMWLMNSNNWYLPFKLK